MLFFIKKNIDIIIIILLLSFFSLALIGYPEYNKQKNNIDNKKFIRHFVDKKIQYGHKIVVINDISSIIWHVHWTNTPTKK